MKTYVVCCGLLGLFAGSDLAQAQMGTMLWSFRPVSSVETYFTGGPALGADGTVYIGSMAGLYALTNSGSNKWTFSGVRVKGNPAVGSDGTVYFGAGNLYAVSPDGALKWSLPLGMQGSSPTIGTSNTVYAVGYEQLYCIAANGTTNWVAPLGDYGTQTPVMGREGSIYAAATDNYGFYAYNADGSAKWSIANFFPRESGETIAIGGDGTLYLAWGSLYAFSPSGHGLWTNSTKSFNGSASPAVGPDGTIYVASDFDYSLYAISPSGQTLWNAGYGTGGFGYGTTTPAIASDGMIYYSASNCVFAISPQGTVQWTFTSAEALRQPPPPILPTINSPALGPDGTIYAAFADTLYAIQGNGKPLATGGWPMAQQNLRHTGRLESPLLAPPQKRADANIDLQVAGESGQAYTLQSTSNFMNWTSVTSFVAQTASTRIADLTASNAPTRFYRATTP